jgi:hypothetical protein
MDYLTFASRAKSAASLLMGEEHAPFAHRNAAG